MPLEIQHEGIDRAPDRALKCFRERSTLLHLMDQLANGTLPIALPQKHERIIRGRIDEVALFPVKLVACKQGILSRMTCVKPRQLIERGPAVPVPASIRPNPLPTQHR